MLEQLVESWQINHRVTLKLLDALADDALQATLSTRGGRNVARQLAHVHEVSLMLAELTSKTNRNAKLPHFAKGESPTKKQLRAAFEASVHGIETSIREGWANDGKLPGFKRGVVPMVGYLIAHQSHHRGSILLTLKQPATSLATSWAGVCGIGINCSSRFRDWQDHLTAAAAKKIAEDAE